MRIHAETGRVIWRKHFTLPDSLETDYTHGFSIYPCGDDLVIVMQRRRPTGVSFTASNFLARITAAGSLIWANAAARPLITSGNNFVGRHADVSAGGSIYAISRPANTVVQVDPANGNIAATVKTGAKEYLICVGETPVDTDYPAMCVSAGQIISGAAGLTGGGIGGTIRWVATDGTTVTDTATNPTAIYAAVPYGSGFFVAAHRTVANVLSPRIAMTDNNFVVTWESASYAAAQGVATDGDGLFCGGPEVHYDFDGTAEIGHILALESDTTGRFIRDFGRLALDSTGGPVEANGVCVLGDSLYVTGWDAK